MTLCRCAGPGSAGSGIVEFRWREALSTEPGGPPNRRQPGYLCRPAAAVFRIHDAVQPEDAVPVLEVIFNVMRSINPRFTYLLTYFMASIVERLRVKPDCCGLR